MIYFVSKCSVDDYSLKGSNKISPSKLKESVLFGTVESICDVPIIVGYEVEKLHSSLQLSRFYNFSPNFNKRKKLSVKKILTDTKLDVNGRWKLVAFLGLKIYIHGNIIM